MIISSKAADLRICAIAAALSLPLFLSGCFVRTDGVTILPEARADAPWLVGAYREDRQADEAPERRASIVKLGDGVYRFESEGGAWPEIYQRAFRALLGRCPPDIEDNLDRLAAEADLGEETDDVREFIRHACAGDVDAICKDDFFADADAGCPKMIAHMRGETDGEPLSSQDKAVLSAYRALAERLPFRDDLTFAALPLDDRGAPGWAIAEIKAIGARGAYAGVAIFRRPLAEGDLLLLQHRTPTEENPNGGMTVWATSDCFVPPLPTTVAPLETALETLTECARSLTDNSAPAPSSFAPRSQTFQRVAE